MEHPRIHIGLAPSTISAYQRILRDFFAQRQVGVDLDDQIVAFVLSRPESAQLTQGEKLISALNHVFPRAAWGIPTARRLIRQIRRSAARTTKPPVIWEVVILVVDQLIRQGFVCTAVAVFLQFDCYLRPAEVTRLTMGDIMLPEIGGLGSRCRKILLLLGKTKTGVGQCVDVRDPTLQRVLRFWHSLATESHISLFPAYKIYAERFSIALQALGLDYLGYTLHGLRHGGATLDLINGGYAELGAIMYRGRWESAAVKTYLQMGAEAAQRTSIPPAYFQQAHEIAPSLPERLMDREVTFGF